MKRSWDATSSQFGNADSGKDTKAWSNMSQHPYAQAYNGLSTAYTSQLHNEGHFDPAYNSQLGKRPRASEVAGSDAASDNDDDDDDDDGDDDGDDSKSGKKAKGKGDNKQKVKLTRGSRACIACRKIKMRCIPDESSGPGGPCKRCKTGGHECIFEESNRGKRSTRKNEALNMRLAKMESALKGVGAALSVLDQPSLNAFSTALHSTTSDQELINVITSHTSPTVVPTLAVAMNRNTYSGSADTHYGIRGEDSVQHLHTAQPPLSPRLHSLPDNVLSPLGLLAEASLQNTDGKKAANLHKTHRPSPLSLDGRQAANRGGAYRTATSDVRGGTGDDASNEGPGHGVASQDYFKASSSLATGPIVGDNRMPELLTIVSREEINELFEIYWDNMTNHVPILYREFHTPDLVLQRSQFLCTVVCAIAARHHKKRPDVHQQLASYAKRLSFEIPSRGYKSVEVVQAYLLLALWTLGPEKTFEQDRTWMMLGMAIRMATDLNLHRKSVMSGLETEEGRARDLEILNRERCWVHCYILDKSISAQMGKPYTLREDYIIRQACEGSWQQQPYALISDRAVAAYATLQQIMSRAIDSIYSSTTTVSGLRQDCDYMLIVRSANEELRRWLSDSMREGRFHPDYMSKGQFYYAYSSLVLYSFGLENALERAKMDISFFLTNVYEAATRVCRIVKDDFLPHNFLSYMPDTIFVNCSYALLSLLKLLKPELRPYHDSEAAIFTTVEETADILENCAVDSSHQPAIYSAFIREIVRKTRANRDSRASRAGSHDSHAAAAAAAASLLTNGQGTMNPSAVSQMYDPELMGEIANWQPEDLMNLEAQFQFIPQGGDMMILPSAAGPSESVQASPSASFNPPNFAQSSLGTPTANNGWAEYLPTFMSTDGFDGWDGSMLLPGFGRNQITLAGGLLHNQFGSGIITPAQHSPAVSRANSRANSRAGSRANSRAQTPHK